MRCALALTVDPARRLATSLGLDSFSEEQRRIDDASLRKAGLAVEGTLDAAMLDTKSTFDRIITTYAPNAEIRDRILANRFYRNASSSLAGSQEYMAMEKLYEIRSARQSPYDLIVLDTPPSSHALDFLLAPGRMLGLMDSDTFRAMLASLKAVGWRAGGGRLSRLVFSGVGRFVGGDVFMNLLEFFESFSSMYDGFSDRSRRVETLLRSDDVRFLIVASPAQPSIDEARFLRETLRSEGMPFGGYVVNRAHLPFVEDGQCCEALRDTLERSMLDEPALRLYDRDIVRRAARHAFRRFEDMQHLVRRDSATVAGLQASAGEEPVFVVPHFSQDIHDLRGLYRFASLLVRGGTAPDSSRAAF